MRMPKKAEIGKKQKEYPHQTIHVDPLFDRVESSTERRKRLQERNSDLANGVLLGVFLGIAISIVVDLIELLLGAWVKPILFGIAMFIFFWLLKKIENEEFGIIRPGYLKQRRRKHLQPFELALYGVGITWLSTWAWYGVTHGSVFGPDILAVIGFLTMIMGTALTTYASRKDRRASPLPLLGLLLWGTMFVVALQPGHEYLSVSAGILASLIIAIAANRNAFAFSSTFK